MSGAEFSAIDRWYPRSFLVMNFGGIQAVPRCVIWVCQYTRKVLGKVNESCERIKSPCYQWLAMCFVSAEIVRGSAESTKRVVISLDMSCRL